MNTKQTAERKAASQPIASIRIARVTYDRLPVHLCESRHGNTIGRMIDEALASAAAMGDIVQSITFNIDPADWPTLADAINGERVA